MTFLVLTGYMIRSERLWSAAVLGTLGLVFAYFLGSLANFLAGWWSVRGAGKRSAVTWWEDAKAALVICSTAGFTIATSLGVAESVPHWLGHAVFGLVLFYFGSR